MWWEGEDGKFNNKYCKMYFFFAISSLTADQNSSKSCSIIRLIPFECLHDTHDNRTPIG